MTKNDKVRIMITLPSERERELSQLCAMLGVTKSQFIAMALGEKMMAYNQGLKAVQDYVSKLQP